MYYGFAAKNRKEIWALFCLGLGLFVPLRNPKTEQCFFYVKKMEKHNKSWYVVITAKVLYAKDITPIHKLLIGIISNLMNEKGYCFAGNEYLSDLLGVNKRSVQRLLSDLEDLGYLGRVINLNPITKEVDLRALTILENTPPHVTDNTTPHVMNNTTPHVTDNTIITNSFNSKLYEKQKEENIIIKTELSFDAKASVSENKETLKTKKETKETQDMGEIFLKGDSDFVKCNEFWLKEFHVGWTYTSVHGKCMKSIIVKLKKIINDSGNPVSVFDTFKSMCIRLPDWYKDKDLQVIDSKFNEIIQQIKNSKNETITKDSNGRNISKFRS